MVIRHKHLKLDQRTIDQARRALGAKTEQETLERALDLVLAEDRIVRLLRHGRGVGGFEGGGYCSGPGFTSMIHV